MRIAILGAGSIGCYVGGRLRATGADVVFCGRPRIADAVRRHGLSLSHYALASVRVPPGDIDFRTDPGALEGADVILVTVKSQATRDAAADIAANAPSNALVVSLQNGVRNAALLRECLPGFAVAAGMVPFNVVNRGKGVFHCGTEGDLVIEAGERSATLAALLQTAGVAAHTDDDMPAVLWGKLLLNLNNALNMLSNRPLKAQLAERDYRRVLACSIEEGLAVLHAAGIRPARVGKVLPGLIPGILRLPDWLFRIVARGMLRIDPTARSSMWEDLQAGRTPEIDYLNGEITRLGTEVGVATPVNEAVVSLVREAFASGTSPALSGAELFARATGSRGTPPART